MENAPTIIITKPRKLQYQGGSVYIALPKDWVTTHNLGEQGSVRITIDAESKLIIEAIK